MKTVIAFLLLSIATPITIVAAEAAPAATKKEVAKPAQANSVTFTFTQLLTLGQFGTLDKLARQDLPALTAYRLSRIIAVLKPEVDRAVKARYDLFTDANSEVVPNTGGARQLKSGKEDEFAKALAPLLAEKINIAVSQVQLETDLAGVKLTAAEMDALSPIIKSADTQ